NNGGAEYGKPAPGVLQDGQKFFSDQRQNPSKRFHRLIQPLSGLAQSERKKYQGHHHHHGTIGDDYAPYVSRQKDGLKKRHVIPCREQIADELNRPGNACKIEDEAGEENRRQKRSDYRNLAGDELVAR